MAQLIIFISPEMQATWDDIMSQMCAFVNDTNADVDMAYDWVCEMLDISSFVDNNTAWDSFYETWESCENPQCSLQPSKSSELILVNMLG